MKGHGYGKSDRHRSLPFFFSARFFVLFLSASALLIPFYFISPIGLALPAALDCLLLLAALVDFLMAPSPREIVLERPLSYPLAVDRANEIAVAVGNRTGHPVNILIQDDVPAWCRTQSLPLRASVAPGSETRLTYRIVPHERGNAWFGNLHFWVLGPLGLVWRHGEIPAETRVKLYPGLALIEKERIKLRRPAGFDPIRLVRKRGQGTEFDSLREYVVGDDSRLVHWPTSARRGKLMIRQNRVEMSQTIFLVLDAGRMMTARVGGRTKLDHALNAALLLSYAALRLGDRAGVMAVAREVLTFIPPSNASGQFGRILDATYALEPRMEEPRFYLALSDLSLKLRRRSLVIAFTDLVDERSSEGLLRYSLGLLPRHLSLVVAMSDTELLELADGEPQEAQDLYRHGVAAEMLERREGVLARLKSAGVMVMDAPPQKISSDVLDRYLSIKTRNLL
jgi:uncharacterized protein (DUF58 family)